MADRPEKPSDEAETDARAYARHARDMQSGLGNLARWALWLESELTAAAKDSEKTLTAVIERRDAFHDAADELAYAIGDESEIGEHSNANNPWNNAIEHLGAERSRHEAELAAAQARIDQLEFGLTMTAPVARTAETEEQAAERVIGAVTAWVHDNTAGDIGEASWALLDNAIRAALAKARGGEGG
jgi:hypothetical protein